MCGIVGIVSQTPIFDKSGSLMTMRDTIIHRGPDDAGIWWSKNGQVGLAHRRLAIIDLSPSGHQPMQDSYGQFTIVFNGEIYNYRELKRDLEKIGHRFRTVSDTEVILEAYRAWGCDCLSRLNGMFAFCLYDSIKQRLFLARDRAGEKPLFYSHVNGRLIFASELKVLMADPEFLKKLDLQSLNFYLAYGYVPGERSMLKGVCKLLPGYAMIYKIETDELKIWRYWQLPELHSTTDSSATELTEELESLLENAVKRQLIADVPIGILLSGGIDSSLVTAMAARISSRPIRTFTVSFPGHSSFDEGPYARIVAEYFGTHHTELEAEPATVEVMPELARQYDEPIADHAVIPTYLLSKMIRKHATVALGGDGGDELFGGYGHYSRIQQINQIKRFIPEKLRHTMGKTAARILPIGINGRNHIIGLAGDIDNSIAHINMYFDQWSRHKLLSPDVQGNIPEKFRSRLCEKAYSPVRKAMEADFRSTLVDGYLVKTDRACMLASLEVRAPFLDYHLIEFAFSRMPDALKVTGKELKILPRRLAKRLLPSSLDLRRKQGFTMPLEKWFDGKWGAYMISVLNDADSNLFNKPMIQHLIACQQRGYTNVNRLFALTMFELWRREYRVSLPN